MSMNLPTMSMNKKTYTAPLAQVLCLNCPVSLLSSSPGIGTNAGPADNSEVFSRRSTSSWDDDDE